MKDKLFSIIIPVYNTQKYLPQCFKSILSQKYNQENYEIIIINDGSTDNSLDVITEYIDRFKNCILISRENKGLLFSRMDGVKRSNGKYILFLDSDDCLTEDCLNIYSEIVSEYDYDFVRGNYITLNKENEKIFNKRYKEEKEILDKKQLYESLLITDNYNCVWGQIIKKSIIDSTKIETKIAMGEDVEINQNCYMNAKNMKIIENYVYVYRYNQNSMTHTISETRLKKNIYDIEMVYSRLIENIKKIHDKRLELLSYNKYINKKDEINYQVVKNCFDNNSLINDYIKMSLESKYIDEARRKLRLRDLNPRKKRIILYFLLRKRKKIYIKLLKIISKIRR